MSKQNISMISNITYANPNISSYIKAETTCEKAWGSSMCHLFYNKTFPKNSSLNCDIKIDID